MTAAGVMTGLTLVIALIVWLLILWVVLAMLRANELGAEACDDTEDSDTADDQRVADVRRRASHWWATR